MEQVTVSVKYNMVHKLFIQISELRLSVVDKITTTAGWVLHNGSWVCSHRRHDHTDTHQLSPGDRLGLSPLVT